ncbi:MAG: hypothetical protein HZA14_07920 [Nitrospirae bacterium]|nr:hypothetical protein [Nitrospirota bacterium]
MKDLTGLLKSVLKFPLKRSAAPLPFDAVFGLFKEVLNSNNRSLEIITDMGDKLGGDYIFDINYIKGAYSELTSSVGSSIKSFNALMQNRYPGIHDAFSRIDNQLRALIDEAPAPSGKLVIPYEDITPDMEREVGGKNAPLADLKNHLRINTPDAFVITTAAFDEFMKINGLDKRLKNGPLTESSLAELQRLIINGEMPQSLVSDIDSAIINLTEKHGKGFALAVRSSAEEEDSDFSFAGQFETVLNVTADTNSVLEAYKKVVASLYSQRAIAYQRQLGYDPAHLKMAVGCMVMIDAAVSGVMYSTNPYGDRDTLLLNASWGLGEAIVEGRTDADFYIVRKGVTPEAVISKAGKKDVMIINAGDNGTNEISTPDEIRGRLCLTAGQIVELVNLAGTIEKHFSRPQDIEWAISGNGRISILQSRPLKMEDNVHDNLTGPNQTALSGHTLIKNNGIAVQKGIAAGKVLIIKKMDELENFPKGSILVSKHDSSNFVRVMPYVSAIITDTGAPTSHMASVCREFRVPTIVNTGNATQILEEGREVTISIDDGLITIYDGIRSELMRQNKINSPKMENIHEFRKKRYVLRYISPLNLVDPLLDEFTVEGCKTIHDVLRFIHEKSVAELIEKGRECASRSGDHTAVKLDLPIPTGILVVDTGSALNNADKTEKITFEQIQSVPLKAVIRGMMHPGVWRSEAVSLKAGDFLSSMMRMNDIVAESGEFVGSNIAVASHEYLHLSLRFGYHFNMIDCYCSENARNNHIYFRFAGGATDITKRSRRIELIASILKEYGFNIRTQGDLIIARLSNISQEETENILDRAGRLIAYTRQLDAMLHDDGIVEKYAKRFLEGKYEL